MTSVKTDTQGRQPEAQLKAFLQGRTVAAQTLGCKTNYYETQAILARLSALGCREVPFDQPADIYLINTCTVTGEAGRKSGQIVRQARRRHAEAVIVALGCQVASGAKLEAADLLIGSRGKSQVAEKLAAYFANRQPSAFSSDHDDPLDRYQTYEELGSWGRQEETRAVLKIQDGCNNFCSYCAIPLARGRSCSRSEAAVLAEARHLAAAGFQELVLTGIHICSYGLDLGLDETALPRLLLKLADIPGVKRLRLGSVEPYSVTPAFAEVLAGVPKLCPHVHLSLQSGCSRTLRRMNRKYDARAYEASAARLAQALPGLNLTTDIIVGFPGETEADHQESLAFCRQIGFGKIHVFRYSARAGTRAAAFPDQVNPAIAAVRSRDFQALSQALWLRRAAGRVGQTEEVLLEQQLMPHEWQGYTRCYEFTTVRLPDGQTGQTGQIMPVCLTGYNKQVLQALPRA